MKTKHTHNAFKNLGTKQAPLIVGGGKLFWEEFDRLVKESNNSIKQSSTIKQLEESNIIRYKQPTAEEFDIMLKSLFKYYNNEN